MSTAVSTVVSAALPPSLPWQPNASRERLQQRAQLFACTREFFAARQVLEVDTPALVRSAVTDVNLRPVSAQLDGVTHYLHTSPEYAMKRLLAAGSGDIYQLCHVFRGEEQSARHNAEFMLLEWYRMGFSMPALIAEVMDLLDAYAIALGGVARPRQVQRYRDVCLEQLSIDPLTTPLAALRELACRHGLDAQSAASLDRDALLDCLLATVVGPALGAGAWYALTHYPASQAALAQLDPEDPAVALRFEIYADGLELANGFVELADAHEQRRRFEEDNRARRAAGLTHCPPDELLLAALAAGLPACAGVALGFDRAMMVCVGARKLDEVLTFTTERA